MKPTVLTTAALLVTFSLIAPVAVNAKDPPASTYQPGPWQPMARANPNRPIEIILINETGSPLEYGLTGNRQTPPRQLLPDRSALLTNFSLPTYVLINPTNSLASLKYDVEVTDNVVTVRIRRISENLPGSTTFNINETGAIYTY